MICSIVFENHIFNTPNPDLWILFQNYLKRCGLQALYHVIGKSPFIPMWESETIRVVPRDHQIRSQPWGTSQGLGRKAVQAQRRVVTCPHHTAFQKSGSRMALSSTGDCWEGKGEGGCLDPASYQPPWSWLYVPAYCRPRLPGQRGHPSRLPAVSPGFSGCRRPGLESQLCPQSVGGAPQSMNPWLCPATVWMGR